MTDRASPAVAGLAVEPMTLPDFCAAFEPPDFLVGGLLLRGGVSSLTGKIGSGRTAIALALAAMVEPIRPLTELGFVEPHRPEGGGRVLIIVPERDRADLAPRLMAATNRADGGRRSGLAECSVLVADCLALEAHFEALRRAVEALGDLALVVVDGAAFTRPQGGGSTADYRALTTLAGRPAVLVVLGPDEEPQGFDAVLQCHRPPGEADLVRLTMKQPWGRMERDFRLVPILDGPARDKRGRSVPTLIAIAAEAAGVE